VSTPVRHQAAFALITGLEGCREVFKRSEGRHRGWPLSLIGYGSDGGDD
jgi:hypothetical protein